MQRIQLQRDDPIKFVLRICLVQTVQTDMRTKQLTTHFHLKKKKKEKQHFVNEIKSMNLQNVLVVIVFFIQFYLMNLSQRTETDTLCSLIH